MDKDKRVEMLINRIEADLKRLQCLTGNNHISTFVVDDFFQFLASEHREGNIITNIDITRRGDEQ